MWCTLAFCGIFYFPEKHNNKFSFVTLDCTPRDFVQYRIVTLVTTRNDNPFHSSNQEILTCKNGIFYGVIIRRVTQCTYRPISKIVLPLSRDNWIV